MNVGEKIKELRKNKGLTQKEFCELFEPKISESALGGWERGNHKPQYKYRLRIAEMANKTVSEFFGSEYIGKVYGELTVIDELINITEKGSSKRNFICKCSCGTVKAYQYENIKSGNTKSCGCLKSKLYIEHRKDITIHTKDFLEKDTMEKGTRLSTIATGREIKKNNTSGKTGVSFNKRTQKWVAYITLKRNQIHLGFFDKKEDAIKARLKAEEEYFVPILEKHKDVFEQ